MVEIPYKDLKNIVFRTRLAKISDDLQNLMFAMPVEIDKVSGEKILDESLYNMNIVLDMIDDGDPDNYRYVGDVVECPTCKLTAPRKAVEGSN